METEGSRGPENQIFRTLASLLLKRTIIFHPVIKVGYDKRTYHPEFLQNGQPFHLLYFSETLFSYGHFQSLRPAETVNDPNIEFGLD